jgi:hypothetical protein
MRSVWKYQIPVFRDVIATFDIPQGARPVMVDQEMLNPGSLSETVVAIWFEVDTTARTLKRGWRDARTGGPADDPRGTSRLVAHPGSRSARPGPV